MHRYSYVFVIIGALQITLYDMICIILTWSQDEETGLVKRTPARIEITFYYPAPFTLSEDISMLSDDLLLKFENVDEPMIQTDAISSAASVHPLEQLPQQPPSALAHPSPSTLDSGLRQIATGSAVGAASSSRSQQVSKPRQAAKKPRAGGPVGPGAAGGVGSGDGGDEEQVFNYVVERFDDDVRLDSAQTPPTRTVDPSPKPPATKHGKKKAQQEVQATEKPIDDVGQKTPMTEAQVRRVAAERLWNAQRSPNARCYVDRFTRYLVRDIVRFHDYYFPRFFVFSCLDFI